VSAAITSTAIVAAEGALGAPALPLTNTSTQRLSAGLGVPLL